RRRFPSSEGVLHRRRRLFERRVRARIALHAEADARVLPEEVLGRPALFVALVADPAAADRRLVAARLLLDRRAAVRGGARREGRGGEEREEGERGAAEARHRALFSMGSGRLLCARPGLPDEEKMSVSRARGAIALVCAALRLASRVRVSA